MQKRTKLFLILLIALLLLAVGIWFFIQPLLTERRAKQPPALPTNVVPYAPQGQAPPQEAPSTAVQAPPTPAENQGLLLEHRARAAVERIGSGASADGFLGYADVISDATANGRAALLAEQQAMQRQHPASGPTYGISTRALSSRRIEGAVGDATLVMHVEAIQRVDAGDPSHPLQIKGKRILVTFVKQSDETYRIEKLVWSDVAL